MIYLVGGSPRCGKTTFSKMLAYEKRISWISSDLVATVVRPYISDAQGDRFFYRNVCSDSPELLLQAEIKNSTVLWPGIKRLIQSLLKWKHDYIIEGVHLFPELIHELESMEQWELVKNEIRVVYLIKKDVQKIIEGLNKSDKASDWLLQCIQTEGDLKNAADMIREKSLYMEKQASKYGYRVINTEEHFTELLEKLAKEF